jgi:hypothetical protein
LLREVDHAVTHVGDHDHRLVLKLAINISLAVQTLAFGEGCSWANATASMRTSTPR